MYKYGCIPTDKGEAAKYYKNAADKGNINAMINYGFILKCGDGIPIDKKETATYLMSLKSFPTLNNESV